MKLKNIGSNMTEVETSNGDFVLVSYSTPVAVRTAEGAYKTDKKWSVTTSRHITKWGGKDWPTKPQEYFDGLI